MTSESLKWAICLKCSVIFHNKYTWHSHLNMRLYNLPIIFSLTISKIPEHLIPRNKAHLCFSLKCCAFNPTVTRALILQDSHNQKFSWILQALPTQRKTNPKKKKSYIFRQTNHYFSDFYPKNPNEQYQDPPPPCNSEKLFPIRLPCVVL